MRHQAINNLYSTIHTQVDDKCYDVNGNSVEVNEAEVATEVIRLQEEFDAQEYARNRQAEFPSIQDLVVALYDTDDKADIQAKRAEVKAKYPKP